MCVCVCLGSTLRQKQIESGKVRATINQLNAVKIHPQNPIPSFWASAKTKQIYGFYSNVLIDWILYLTKIKLIQGIFARTNRFGFHFCAFINLFTNAAKQLCLRQLTSTPSYFLGLTLSIQSGENSFMKSD